MYACIYVYVYMYIYIYIYIRGNHSSNSSDSLDRAVKEMDSKSIGL